jgi:hypothetical protein
MPHFLFLFRGGGYAAQAAPSPTELQAHLADWKAWTDGLLASGKLVVAHALTHPPAGKTVRGREKAVTDGPYAESKDLVSGTVVVAAASLDEAAEIAKGCPILAFDGSVEVRPLIPAPAK